MPIKSSLFKSGEPIGKVGGGAENNKQSLLFKSGEAIGKVSDYHKIQHIPEDIADKINYRFTPTASKNDIVRAKTQTENTERLRTTIPSRTYDATYVPRNANPLYASSNVANKPMLDYDINTGSSEIDNLQSVYDIVEKRNAAYIRAKNKLQHKKWSKTKIEQAALLDETVVMYDEQLKSLGYKGATDNNTVNQLKKELNEKKQFHNQSKVLQKGVNLTETAITSKDFDKKGMVNADFSKDEKYKYINDIGGYRDIALNNYYNQISTQASEQNGVAYVPKPVVLENNYSYMTDEEVKIYNYYYATQGAEKANEYLEVIQRYLNERASGDIVDLVGDSNIAKVAYGGYSELKGVGDNIKNLLGPEKEYYAPSAQQLASQKIRQTVDGAWGVAYDVAGAVGGMLPSVLTSTVVGFINPAAGAVVGSAIIGASSAGNAYSEMINLGYDKSQAKTYAGLVGSSEALLQYLLGGIGKLGGKITGNAITKIVSGIDNAFAKFAIKWGASAVAEGIEESSQSLLEPLFENIAAGYDVNTWEDVEWSEVIYSGLLGMLTGGLFELAPSATETYRESAEAKSFYGDTKENTQALINEGKAMPQDSRANKLAQKYQQQFDKKGDLSGTKLHNLVEANEQAMLSADKTKIKAAAEQRLSMLGEKFDKGALADIIVKEVSGETVTNSERVVLNNSVFGNRVLNELTPSNVQSEQYSSDWVKDINTDRINSETYSLQQTSQDDIINQGGEKNELPNQRTIGRSIEKGMDSRGKSQMGKSYETIDGYVQGGKAEILSGGAEEVSRRVRINHTENSNVTFTEGKVDDTEGYKAYTAFANAGIKVIYCDGMIERTVNGVTVTRTEAFTAPDGTVYVSSESSLPAKQTFDHEKVHVAQKTNNPAYMEYESALCESAIYYSSTYFGLAEDINKYQFNNKYDIEDISTSSVFMREIAAYMNQFVLSDPAFAEQTFGGMFSDWEAVVEAVNKFNTDMGADFTESANFMPENDTSGSGEFGRADGEIATFGGIDTGKGRHLDKAQQDEIKGIGEKLGREVEFEDFYELSKFKGKKKIPDGYIDKDGKVHINYFAKRPVHFLLKHEITHYLKRSLKSYVDFMNMVFKSEAFEDWLSKKGKTLTSLKAEKMDTYSEIKNFNEERCFDEILADFVGEYLFGGEYAVSQRLINALEPKKKKTFGDVIRSIINYFKKKFSKNKTLKTEIEQIENEFVKVYKEAAEVKADEASADIGEYEYINPLSVTETDISQNLIEISKMNAVSTLTGQEFAKGEKDLVTQVDDFFNEYNYSIENSLLGDVEITARGAKDSIAHGIGRNKAIAFAAVPDVIQQGKIIDYQKNWKNRGYDTIVLAAPITINNDPYYEGVIVIRDSKTQRFYVHEVITEKRTDTLFKTGANKNVGKSGNVSSPSIISLLDKIREVKENLTFEEVDNNNSMLEDEDYSIPSSTTDRKSILTDLANGTITVEQAEKLLSSKKTLNPTEVANLSQKDADTTASEHKRQQGENNGDGESKFYDSLMKSNIFDLRFKDEIKDDSFIEKYKTITNKETLKTAAKELDEGGWDYVERWWAKTPERASLIDTAVGFILMDRYQRVGKYEQAVAAAEKARAFGTAAGQQVQIFSVIGRFNPDMMAAYAQHELTKAYEKMVEGKTKKWIDNNKDRFELTDKEIEFIRVHTIQAAMFEEGSRGRAVALGEICTMLQDKIPAQKGDDFKAFQRICMLLNAKTNLRNITGNAGMVGVFIASDFFGSGIDKMVSKKTGVRTTGNISLKSFGKGFAKGAYETLDDFKRGIHTKQEELNRFEANTSRGKNFNEHRNGPLKRQLNDCAKFLNKLDNFTSFCLEAGDRPFFEAWFLNSLNKQKKLNNTDVPTVEMLEIAREEALQRTWQDDNMFTRAAAKVRDAFNIVHFPNSTYGLGDFVYKFIKTPTNIAKAIVEFSPAGFAGAAVNARKLKNAIETNQFKPQMQKEYVRSLSNAITGTLLYTLVAVGASLGLVKLSGDGDDDKDVGNYEKYILGIPPYSIEFLGVDISYDWMQPFGSVLAVVAEFMESREDDPQGNVAGDVLEAVKAGGKIFAEQSFLQGLYNLCSSEDWIEGLSSIALAEPSVYIPQALSQTASFFDPYRRNSYDASNGFKNAVNKMIAKIPGLRNTLAKQKNTLGEDAENPQYMNPWLSFASPWNTYPKSSNEVIDDIYKLYKESGDKSVMPRVAPNYVEVKENRITFSPQQKSDFQKSMGDQSVQMLTELFNSKQYATLSDQQKVKVVGRIYSYSYAKAKAELKFDYQTLSAMVGKYKNGQPILTEKDYERLPEEARKMLAQEYFLSKTEIRYLNDNKGLVEYYINQSKQ